MSLKEWETVQRINLTSMFLTIREVLPGMLARKSGVIVNVSSIASMRWTGVPFVSYASSKAGVNQLTQSIAMEHALDGIRCNAVVPGFIDTPTVYAGLAADDHQRAIELKDERSRVCPTGAMGDAWDVANATLFLASEESRYITGNLLVIDGGLSHQIATPISGNSHYG
jgi:NAD(P)-dependent dehydrogenase (short-subunit alcohol dehydrogenase family)